MPQRLLIWSCHTVSTDLWRAGYDSTLSPILFPCKISHTWLIWQQKRFNLRTITRLFTLMSNHQIFFSAATQRIQIALHCCWPISGLPAAVPLLLVPVTRFAAHPPLWLLSNGAASLSPQPTSMGWLSWPTNC